MYAARIIHIWRASKLPKFISRPQNGNAQRPFFAYRSTFFSSEQNQYIMKPKLLEARIFRDYTTPAACQSDCPIVGSKPN